MNGPSTNMTRDALEGRLREVFQPVHLEIVDDSARHAGHAGNVSKGGHFNVVIAAAAFEGKTLVEQHRMVNGALKELIGGAVHALGLRTLPASAWKEGQSG